jgi:hypothetical protein
MNVAVGIVIGLAAGTWVSVAKYSLYWAILHVVYGYLFGMHGNPVVNSSEGGNPTVSYYGARFMTGLLTAGAPASLTLSVACLSGLL